MNHQDATNQQVCDGRQRSELVEQACHCLPALPHFGIENALVPAQLRKLPGFRYRASRLAVAAFNCPAIKVGLYDFCVLARAKWACCIHGFTFRFRHSHGGTASSNHHRPRFSLFASSSAR